MMNIEQLAEHLYGRTLKDILVAGYIDTLDSVKRFHPMFEDIYFDFDGIILRASSIQQFWYLGLEVIDKIDRRFELEDDDEFAVCSLEFVLAFPSGPNIARSLVVFTEPDELAGNGNIVCAALEFDCGDVAMVREVVFLNPRNEFGIHLGTRAALEGWRCQNALATVPFIEQSFPIDIEVQNQKTLILKLLSTPSYRESTLNIIRGTDAFISSEVDDMEIEYTFSLLEAAHIEESDVEKCILGNSKKLEIFCRAYMEAQASLDLGQEYNADEENDIEEPSNEVYGGHSQTFLMQYAILFILLSTRPDDILEYLKQIREPKAKKQSVLLKKLYAETFHNKI